MIAPFYTRVHNYIDVVKLADFTNMMGMPTGFVQLRFANRDAELYGVDVSGSLALWRSYSDGTAELLGTASWLSGRTLDAGGSLHHKTPFHATFALEPRLGGWAIRVELREVAEPNRGE